MIRWPVTGEQIRQTGEYVVVPELPIRHEGQIFARELVNQRQHPNDLFRCVSLPANSDFFRHSSE